MSARCLPDKIDYTSTSGRLRLERCRLNLSQLEAAQLVEVSAGTWRGWEANIGSPSARALETFADAGADPLFIISGVTRDHWRCRHDPMPFVEVVGRRWLETLGAYKRRELMLQWLEDDPAVRRNLLYNWIEYEIGRRRHGYRRGLRAVLDILKIELG